MVEVVKRIACKAIKEMKKHTPMNEDIQIYELFNVCQICMRCSIRNRQGCSGEPVHVINVQGFDGNNTIMWILESTQNSSNDQRERYAGVIRHDSATISKSSRIDLRLNFMARAWHLSDMYPGLLARVRSFPGHATDVTNERYNYNQKRFSINSKSDHNTLVLKNKHLEDRGQFHGYRSLITTGLSIEPNCKWLV